VSPTCDVRCFRESAADAFRQPVELFAGAGDDGVSRAGAYGVDETKVLDGKIAQYVAVARRNGKDWYVGAMTNWSPRELEIDFSFLPDRNFSLQAYQDGVNADRMGSDYKMTKTQVNRGLS